MEQQAVWLREYYKEADPIKRKKLLEIGIREEGLSRDNQIRQEIYEVRYAKPSGVSKSMPADGMLGLWMALEYNKSVTGGIFGFDYRRAKKEISEKLRELKIREYMDRGEDEKRLMQEELCHMIRTYMDLSLTDRSYGSTLFGLMKMGTDELKSKLRADIREIALSLPERLELEEELAPIREAAAVVFEEFFPLEGGLEGE